MSKVKLLKLPVFFSLLFCLPQINFETYANKLNLTELNAAVKQETLHIITSLYKR